MILPGRYARCINVTLKEMGIGGIVWVLILSVVCSVNNHSSSSLGVSPPLEGITGTLGCHSTSILYHHPFLQMLSRSGSTVLSISRPLVPPSNHRDNSFYLSTGTFPPQHTEPWLFLEADRAGYLMGLSEGWSQRSTQVERCFRAPPSERS